MAEVTWTAGDYAGVRMRRAILWRDEYFVDVFTVICDRERVIDWVWHNRGVLTAEVPKMPASRITHHASRITLDADLVPLPEGLRDGTGYEHLAEVCRGSGEGPVTLTWQGAVGRHPLVAHPFVAGLRLFLRSEPGEEWFTAHGPGQPATERLPLVLRRCRARHATFAAVFHPFGAAPTVRGVRWEEERCVVETEGGEEMCEWAWLEKVNIGNEEV